MVAGRLLAIDLSVLAVVLFLFQGAELHPKVTKRRDAAWAPGEQLVVRDGLHRLLPGWSKDSHYGDAVGADRAGIEQQLAESGWVVRQRGSPREVKVRVGPASTYSGVPTLGAPVVELVGEASNTQWVEGSTVLPQPHLRELLEAYAGVQRRAEPLGFVTWVSLGQGSIASRVRLPLVSRFVPLLLSSRINRCIAALQRCAHERAALAPTAAAERDVAALEHFALSLPVVPKRRLTVAFVLLVLVVAYALAAGVFRSARDARGLAHAMHGVLVLDPDDAIRAMQTFGFGDAAGAFFIVGLAALIVAAPGASAFCFQRILFNTGASVAPSTGRDDISTHVARSTGIYTVETRAFAAFGTHPPRETPIDLVVAGIALLIPIWISSILAFVALTAAPAENSWGVRVALLLAAAMVCALVVDVLLSLRATARRRHATEAEPARAQSLRRRRAGLGLRASALAGAIAAAAIGGSLALSTVDSLPQPQAYWVDIDHTGLNYNVAYGEFLNRQHVATRPAVDSDLRRLGLVVSYTVRMSVPRDAVIGVKVMLFRAKPPKLVRATTGRVLAEGSGRSSEAYTTSGLLTISLPLFHLQTSQSPPPTVTDRCLCAEWVALPRRSGRFFVQIALFAGRSGTVGEPLNVVRTKTFRVTVT